MVIDDTKNNDKIIEYKTIKKWYTHQGISEYRYWKIRQFILGKSNL